MLINRHLEQINIFFNNNDKFNQWVLILIQNNSHIKFFKIFNMIQMKLMNNHYKFYI